MTLLETSIIDYSYLTQLVGHLSGLAHLRATQLCSAELAELELTPKQFVALEFISKNQTITQKPKTQRKTPQPHLEAPTSPPRRHQDPLHQSLWPTPQSQPSCHSYRFYQ